MKEIVINKCFGGFGLSHMAIMHWARLSGREIFWEDHGYLRYYFYQDVFRRTYDKDAASFFEVAIARDDAALVETVLWLGDRANGDCAELNVVEIPDDVEWEIVEYDGLEHVAEVHRTWG